MISLLRLLLFIIKLLMRAFFVLLVLFGTGLALSVETCFEKDYDSYLLDYSSKCGNDCDGYKK